MALIVNDRVKETTTTTGTGTVSLDGAAVGFETFVSAIGDGNSTYYCIFGGNEFEVGQGTVTSAVPDTLSRDVVISSTNSDALVNFSAGEKQVFCTLPARKTPSPSMDATTYVFTHSTTISEDQTIESGVLAGPVTITGNVTATGTLVIV